MQTPMNGGHVISIERNGQIYGPYTPAMLQQYLAANQLLLNDWAIIDGRPERMVLGKAMKRCGIGMPRSHSLCESLKRVGWDFLFPWQILRHLHWLKDRRILCLLTVGLLPLIFVLLGMDDKIIYLLLALYFSIVWGMFFYTFFGQGQVQPWRCIRCFFETMAWVLVLLAIHASGLSSIPGMMADSETFSWRFLGMFLAAGLPEEICKALAIFRMSRRPGEIIVPQKAVLYGLFSGLGFGIFEGVMYQMDFNREQGVDNAYFLNVLRLTSLPFLHAVWCGISSYFIAFAALFPMHRYSLWVIAILIPATIHALYNSIGLFGMIPAAVSIVLFSIYLANARVLKQKLI